MCSSLLERSGSIPHLNDLVHMRHQGPHHGHCPGCFQNASWFWNGLDHGWQPSSLVQGQKSPMREWATQMWLWANSLFMNCILQPSIRQLQSLAEVPPSAGLKFLHSRCRPSGLSHPWIKLVRHLQSALEKGKSHLKQLGQWDQVLVSDTQWRVLEIWGRGQTSSGSLPELLKEPLSASVPDIKSSSLAERHSVGKAGGTESQWWSGKVQGTLCGPQDFGELPPWVPLRGWWSLQWSLQHLHQAP